MRQELIRVLDLMQTLPVEEVPEVLGQLETCRLIGIGRLNTPTDAAKPEDEWLTAEQAAKKIHKSPDWIYRAAKNWKFAHRVGNRLLVSASGLDKFLKSKSREEKA
jgi:hypothetical protein